MPTRLPNNHGIHLPTNSVPPPVQHRERTTTLRGVGQDKTAPERDRIASVQPAPRKNMMRPQHMDTNTQRSQNRLKKRKTVSLTLWVRPQLKAEIQRIAEAEGLSVSQTGGAGLEEWVRQKLHVQHAVLLQPIIETTIRKELSRTFSRFVLFMVQIAFEAGQTRRIATNILSRQPGVTSAMLEHILDASSDATRKTITRKTPPIASLIEEVEQWLREEEGTNT
jgi:hypothetical protein